MKTHTIASIPADGIGPEVIAAGLQALEVLARRDGGFELAVIELDWGSDRYKRRGALMPDDGAERLKRFDAILLCAVGAPDVPDHVSLWGLRLPICQGLDQYANVRPTRIQPGIRAPLANVGPGDLDRVIVRENSEGEFAGMGGRAHRGFPEEVGTEVAVFTRAGVARIMRYAFDITGKGIANPVATFWSASQLLEHLGETDAAQRLMRAVEQVCGEGIMTPDVGGKSSTREVTDAVCEAVRGAKL